ncbi:unnamed protein product [Clonostachys rosea f. rosea IK726]|uniref:FZ domain-containing protein n=2 Tax=Bionectria ochroleuca TaxID=29856 RepID=A0A0B7JRH3_BIOOC|nr:unnamed protein product [Clonostachys rosea f. rosea IK726]
MALSPLQSRLVASLGASLLLFAIYLLLFSPQLASATELPVRDGFDLGLNAPLDDEQSDIFEPAYQPDFAAFDRSIIGRAPSGLKSLGNNIVKSWNLNPGETVCYVFTTGSSRTQTTQVGGTSTTATATAASNGKRDSDTEIITPRAAKRKIYVSANTCLQPTQTNNSTKDRLPPQLILAASTSGDTGCSQPTSNQPNQAKFDEGSATVIIEAEGDVFITLTAPNVTEGFDGVYNFEVAASTDAYFHSYDGSKNTTLDSRLVHSDARGVLLSTNPLTTNESEYKTFEKLDPLPYKLFVENANLVLFDGLRKSICGMKNAARSFTEDLVTMSMTPGIYEGPRQRFRFEGLNSSSSYRAILVQMDTGSETKTGKRQNGDEDSSNDSRNGKIGGGGVVFGELSFDTSSDKSTCKIVSNLDFCGNVSWAVPGNSSASNAEVGQAYDDYAKGIYESFKRVMMQVPCEEGNSSRYSLINSCDECEEAYKEWLCTVTFPRCEDYSSSTPGLKRNVNSPFPDGSMVDEEERNNLSSLHKWHNMSRNLWIEENIKPGPYKEVLPCDEVCFEVVRRCPAAIQFGCPKWDYPGFDGSYAMRGWDDQTGLTCNALGTSQDQVGIAHLLQPQALGIFSMSLLVSFALYL